MNEQLHVERTGEQIPLDRVTFLILERAELSIELDTFSNDLEFERPASRMAASNVNHSGF